MADIELVIKIDKEDYKKVLESNNRDYEWNDMCTCYEAVFKGTPLPKGHGRLIDADEQIFKIEEIYNGYMLSEDGGVTPSDFVEFLEEAPTIIKADKEDRE